MSFWSDFIGTIKETATGAGRVAKTIGSGLAEIPKSYFGGVTQAGASYGASQISKGYDPQARAIAGVAAAQGTQKALEKAGIAVEDSKVAKISDPVMKVAALAEEKVFSPYIKRPISTGFLLTDPNSALYKTDEYKKGFQPSDIIDAYERSEKVSLGVAFTKSWIAGATPVGQLEQSILSKVGKINLDEVDLWNDEDIEKNFVDNPVGRFISGANDLIFGEGAVNLAFSGGGAVAKAAILKAGLSTKFRTGDFDAIKEFNTKVDEHLLHRATNGEQGAYSVVGEDIEKMAAAKTITEVRVIANKYTYNRDVFDYVSQTEDPALIRDLLLMDKGDFSAYQRLVDANQADKAWTISKGSQEVLKDYLENGKVREYTPEQRLRWMQAHDDAIKNDPQLERIFNSFFEEKLDKTTNELLAVDPRVLAKDYKPMEPVVGKELLGSIRTKRDKLKAAALQRDFSKIGGVTATVLNSKVGAPITVLMRTVGTYMPQGFVTHSGLRPMQGLDEIVATFDDIPTFRLGSKVITTHERKQMTVSEYRSSLLSEFAGLRSDGDRAKFVDDLNWKLTYSIGFTRGFTNTRDMDNFVKSLKTDILAVHGDLTNYGYAMTPDGVRIGVKPIVQQNLADSTPLLPFGTLDRMISREVRKKKSLVAGAVQTKVGTAAEAAKIIFEMGNKAFSFSQLYRFSYIPKNSIFEPLLSGFFAEGAKFAAKAVTTASDITISKTANLLKRNIFKAKTTLPKSAIKETQREIDAIQSKLGEAIRYRDERYAEFHEYFVTPDGRSPKTKGRYADEVREELREAEKLVENIEAELNVYTVEVFGDNIKSMLNVPSIFTLRRRIDTLKKAGAAKYGSEIRSAEIALGRAVAEMNTLAPDLIRIDKEIAQAYDNIGKLMDDLKPALKKEAELLSVVDEALMDEPKLPETWKYTTNDGRTYEVPLMSDRNHFGDGYVSEIANTSTRTIEILGNKSVAGRIKTASRRNADTITYTSDPEYFSELAYVVNNRMRGDMIVDKILAGANRNSLLAWGATTEGRSYAISMGKRPEDIVEIIDNSLSYVNGYLPTAEAKAAALKGPVAQTELQFILADKIDQMLPIQPLDIPYTNPKATTAFINKQDAVLAKAWTKLLAPENFIRQVYGNVAHARLTFEKAKALEAAGQVVDYNTLMTLRNSAAVEIVDNLRKVFYTIPRQHRALYLARAAVVFPNAAFSGFYRYTGFAARQPRRVAGFLNAYYSLYNSYGVDKYGNPVENPQDAEYLLIPGTKEMGFNNGKGIILSSRATSFLVNLPGPNWFVPYPVSYIYSKKPNSEELVREFVDKSIGKIPGMSYDEIFPYGIQPNASQAISAFTPSWARDLIRAFRADETDLTFRTSLEAEAQRLNIMYRMGVGPKPTEEMIFSNTRKLYIAKARTKFFSILGSAQVLGQYGVGLYEDYYQMLVANNKAKGMNDNEALDEAEKQFQSQMRLSDTVGFPTERLFVGVRDKRAYFTPSTKSYERIYEEFPYLSKKLEDLDPRTVGILTADLPRDYNSQVARFLNNPNATLPGGTLLNTQIKSRQEIEKEIELNKFWAAYTAKIKELNAMATAPGKDYASYRSVPELVEERDRYVQEVLRPASESWYNEFVKGATKGDSAVVFAEAIKTVANDPKFAKKYGNSQFWVHAKAFVERRSDYAKAYKDAASGSKGDIRELWLQHLDETEGLWDPALQRIITRYFSNDNLREK